MVDLRYRIHIDLFTAMKSKAARDGWDIAHLGRSLIDLWVRGEIRAGAPQPGRKRGTMISTGFRLEADLKKAFQSKAREKGWEMSALLVRLLRMWLDGLVYAGSAMTKWDERCQVLQDGKFIKCYTLTKASFVLGVSPVTLRKRLKRDKQSGRVFKITPTELDQIERELFPQ